MTAVATATPSATDSETRQDRSTPAKIIRGSVREEFDPESYSLDIGSLDWCLITASSDRPALF